MLLSVGELYGLVVEKSIWLRPEDTALDSAQVRLSHPAELYLRPKKFILKLQSNNSRKIAGHCAVNTDLQLIADEEKLCNWLHAGPYRFFCKMVCVTSWEATDNQIFRRWINRANRFRILAMFTDNKLRSAVSLPTNTNMSCRWHRCDRLICSVEPVDCPTVNVLL